MIITMVGLIFTRHYLLAFIPITFMAYGTGTIRPILTSKITTSVGEKEYATILGISNSMNSVAQIITPILGGAILLYLNSNYILTIVALLFVFEFLFLCYNIRKQSALTIPS